jgi:hypothetical protein
MRKDEYSGRTATHPVTGRADCIDATVKKEEVSPDTASSCTRHRPDWKAVGGLAGCMLLFALTCSSVSAYQMSAHLSGIIIALSLLLIAYLIFVAVRCRNRPEPVAPDQ